MENPTTIAIDLSKNVFEIAVECRGAMGIAGGCRGAMGIAEALALTDQRFPNRSRAHLLQCGTPAAGAGSKSSLKGPSGTPASAVVVADVCAPCYDANLKRWTERAKLSGNSHCTPTDPSTALQLTPSYRSAATFGSAGRHSAVSESGRAHR
jgi:hypothetical protein